MLSPIIWQNFHRYYAQQLSINSEEMDGYQYYFGGLTTVAGNTIFPIADSEKKGDPGNALQALEIEAEKYPGCEMEIDSYQDSLTHYLTYNLIDSTHWSMGDLVALMYIKSPMISNKVVPPPKISWYPQEINDNLCRVRINQAGKDVGSLLLFSHPDYPEYICYFDVQIKEKYQKQGLGSYLMQLAQNWIIKRKKMVKYHILHCFIGIVPFYTQLGYQVLEYIPSFLYQSDNE